MSLHGWWSGLAPRDRRAASVGAWLIAPALVIVLVVRPYRALTADLDSRLDAQRDLLARESALVAMGDSLTHAFAGANAVARDTRLIDASTQPLAEAALSDELETWARESRVLLSEMRAVAVPRGEAAPPDTWTIRLSVRGESDFEGVLRFLERVESAPTLVRVRSLSLQPALARTGGGGAPADARPTGVVQAQMVIEAYARPNQISQP